MGVATFKTRTIGRKKETDVGRASRHGTGVLELTRPRLRLSHQFWGPARRQTWHSAGKF